MKSLKSGQILGTCLLAWALTGGMSAVAHAQALNAEERAMIRDSWIFVFHDSVPRVEVAVHAQRMSASVGASVGHVYENSIRGFSARMSAQAAAQLAAKNPQIRYYEADQIARANAKPTSSQPQQSIPWGITRVRKNRIATLSADSTPCAGKSAWIIDTGIDQTHPDLNVDTKGRSKNFVSSGTPTVNDGNGHGSHVAGIIGARNNTIGVVGVCPGTQVIAVRVLNNQGSGTWSDVIAGVDYVGANGNNGNTGDVANMSLGGGFSQAINDAVTNASNAHGVNFAIAAGNSAANAKNYSPASAEGPHLYTVSAFDGGDNFAASFSNFGNPPIDYSGPGVSIYSTYKNGGYATLSGTSMAAPHVAGVLLLGGCVNGGTVKGDVDGSSDIICIAPAP